MPDKLVRDELLRSHRYQSLHSDTTKLVFVHLLLASDNLSNAEATTTALSLLLKREVSEQAAAQMLTELGDHDLVRVYEDEGKRYVHIPRSRQRLRYVRGKHPRPPSHIEDNQIKELVKKVGLKTDPGQAQDRRKMRYASASASALQLPLNPLSGSQANPDGARVLLDFLNRKAGRHFRPTEATLKPIIARLKEGNTVSDCRAMIAHRWRAWKDRPDMVGYMRPETLFGPAKFAQYMGDVPADDDQQEEPDANPNLP